MPPCRYLLTGTPDLALTLAAARLDAAGLACSLDTSFAGGLEASGWTEEQVGDASWRMGSHTHLLPPGTVVLHVVRDPRASVPELAAGPWVDPASREGRVVRAALPAVMEFPTEDERALALWYGWHALIEEASGDPGLRYARFLVEALDDALVQEIGGFLGRPTLVVGGAPDVALPECAPAFPEGALLDEVLGMAARYGYPAAADVPG